MQIVIKMTEDDYSLFQDYMTKDGMEYLLNETTILPKGHGRLIDVNELLDDIGLEDNDYNRDCNTGEIITLENIDRIPTIVEADEEE